MRHWVAAGAGLLLAALGVTGLRDPLASMASYTAALMLLNQAVPPLLLLGRRRPLRSALFDPVIATTAFVGLSVGVSLPGLLDPTLANALYAAPLGALEVLTGLMFWGQLFTVTSGFRHPWQAALLVWLGSLPMMAVAVVWMLSDRVIYTPYLDVICQWDIPPLMDQRWAGLVMFIASVPLQLVATWKLIGLQGSHAADRTARSV